MTNRSEKSEDQRCAKMARIFGDDLTAHMHEYLHAQKSGEELNPETAKYFTDVFEKSLRAQKGLHDAPAATKRKALSDALGLKLRAKGRPEYDGINLTIQFRLAWQVHMLHTSALDREGRLIKVAQAINLVAVGMNQTDEVVKLARKVQRTQVCQDASGELAVFEDSVVPKRRSVEIAQQLVELAAKPMDRFEMQLPLNQQETGLVLSFPPSKKALGQMMVGHGEQDKLERVLSADANGGIREAGTPGYDASVDYVIDRLSEAGYTVELDEFDITYVPPVTLQQLTPVDLTYESGAFTGSDSGTVTGSVIPVDLALDSPQASTSGCEASDFDGLDFNGPADIALIQRGACFFSEKAVNAEAAGAEAVIIFNQGTPTREGLIVGNASALPDGSTSNLTVPVVGASFAQGMALAEPNSTAFINIDPSELRTQVNVLAELPGKNDDNVVMVGAHLDSVRAGPGIQDNGSGSAGILEVALQMAQVKPRNTVRFAWWSGEELGLVGSTAYVADLAEEELEDIALYLNFDMIGSPKYVLFIYDGDDSDGVGVGPGPEGSAQIEQFFEAFYEGRGRPYLGTDFSGRSDYGPFIVEGIPAGGLFTGAEGIKTPEQAAAWGGTAGEQYDPCYHLACDTLDNISLDAFDVNVDAVAAATLQFAMNTVTVNGVRGKGNFKPEGPQPRM